MKLDDIVKPTDFEATYTRTSIAKKSLRTLEEAGVFPLTLKNPKLVFLNTLGLYVYLSGNLDYYRLSYHATISNEIKHHLPLDEWKNQFGKNWYLMVKVIRKLSCLIPANMICM